MARNLLHYIFNNDSFNHTLSPPAIGGLLFCLFFRILKALYMTNDVTIFSTADEMFLTPPLDMDKIFTIHLRFISNGSLC
jgi:hypothetical protein